VKTDFSSPPSSPFLTPVPGSHVFQGILYSGASMSVSIIATIFFRSVFWIPGFYGRSIGPFERLEAEPSNVFVVFS